MQYDASKLKRERLIKGWTKKRLAKIVGVDNAIIRRVENGENQSPETIRKMADALGVPMEAIVIDTAQKKKSA